MTTDTSLDWRFLLKGKISDDILELKDARGNNYFDCMNTDLLIYFEKNISNKPWANQLALYMVVSLTRNLSPKTIQDVLKALSNRFDDLFVHYALQDTKEFNPDIHMYAYLKNEVLSNHSIDQKARFLRYYVAAEAYVKRWVRNNISPDKRSVFQDFQLQTPTFDRREFNLEKQATELAQHTRKLETSAITPMLPQLRAEGHFRKNQVMRLRNKLKEVIAAAEQNSWSLPVAFDYEESNGDKFYFNLWDKPSFVLAHRDQFTQSSVKAATSQTGAYSSENNETFVEFIRSERSSDGSEGDGLWFLELIKEDVLGLWSQNKNEAELQKRLNFLRQWGYCGERNETNPVPFYTRHKGVLGQSTFISKFQSKAQGILFHIEPIYVAVTFGYFALNLFTSSGIRMNELLQIAYSQACVVVADDNNHTPPRKSFMFRLIPKGRDEAENFYVHEDIFKLMLEIIQLLREHYKLNKNEPIPSVKYENESRKHMFGYDRYLFQYNGKSFDTDVIQATLCFLLHGIVMQTDEGGQVNIKAHLLRHAFATHAVQTEKLPIDIVKEILHQKNIEVTGYYSQPTHGQIGQAVSDLHDNWMSYIDIQQGILRSPEELQRFYKEYSDKVGTMSKVVGGICTTDAVCPTKMACMGCAAKVPRPEFKTEIHQFLEWAVDSEKRFKTLNLPLEAKKMKLVQSRARNELKEIELVEKYVKDEKYDPTVRINKQR
ncbi:site-specific integrase [Paenibacillus sp. LHD-38]|uniref:site-specific integrase n=1 Tax=Paenibacillus sp. LHD-38 TaxID=3072143 RepID=UPI00280C7E2E|nr:site-specific integrase [Paenibacillus sp. LHD-38]MDQ8738153.1 site-specific integrase [Paenibacillus sp. LHD-38]